MRSGLHHLLRAACERNSPVRIWSLHIDLQRRLSRLQWIMLCRQRPHTLWHGVSSGHASLRRRLLVEYLNCELRHVVLFSVRGSDERCSHVQRNHMRHHVQYGLHIDRQRLRPPAATTDLAADVTCGDLAHAHVPLGTQRRHYRRCDRSV